MSNKIKILEMFGEPLSYGGEEAVVYNMIKAIGFDEFYYDLFTPYFANNVNLISLIENDINSFNELRKGHVYSLNLEAKTNDNRFLLSEDIDKFLSKHNDYDIVHIHTGSLSTMCLYSKIAKKYNIKKVIVHSHCAGYKENIIHKLQKFILNIILQQNADYFLSCSKEASKWKYTGNALKNSIIVLNGIDTSKFSYNEDYRNEIRNKYNINNYFLIGQVGRLCFQKNQIFSLNLLKECLKLNKHFKLMLIGDGPDKTILQNYVKNHELDDNVIFVNNTNEVEKYYSAFDCLIMPSNFEGMPVVAIEAQCAKNPSLFSKKIDREIHISNCTTFLDIDKTNDWVNYINKFKENKNNKYSRDEIIVNSNKFDYKYSFEVVRNIYKG